MICNQIQSRLTGRMFGVVMLSVMGALQLPTAANAQVVTLVCSPGPNQPGQTSIDLDYGRSVANYPYPGIPMNVSDRAISWQTQRRLDPSGLTLQPGHFSLDRMTGEFRQQYFCDGCVPIPVLFCKPGAKLF